MKDKLNLGSGFDIRPDFHNVDNAGKPDQIVDISTMHWDLPSDHFVEIIAQDIIEHFLDTVGFMNECWRVTKMGGTLFIRTPSFDAAFAHVDPSHIRFFHIDTFDFFDPTTGFGHANRHLSPFKWKLLSKVKTANKNLEIKLQKIAKAEE